MFQQLFQQLKNLFEDRDKTKDLQQCGDSVYALFESARLDVLSRKENCNEKIDALIDYCNETILLYPFKDVPDHWRRMLIDTGLLKTMAQLERCKDVQSLIWDLDTCSIVSGAPERYEIVTDILEQLQKHYHKDNNKDNDMSLASKNDIWMDIKYPIKSMAPPTFEWFLAHCNQDLPEPIVIKGLIDHWPATERWKSTRYLLSIASARVVPVEIGSSYTDSEWRQEMMRFSDFMKKYILTETDGKVAYLAQHDLFYQIPQLERDMIVPDYCYIEPKLNEFYTQRPKDVIKNAWFGPKGTVSPLHHDPYHNLLVQVVGSKYLRLYSPDQTHLLYPRQGLMSNTSKVDVDHVDHEQFPSFKDAHYVECILREGEVLYIPPKWWHYVKSLETSFNVSLWF